jgi:hypothetical protein
MKLSKVLLVTGFAAVLALGATSVSAQQGGGGGGGGRGGRTFDPAQMRQRLSDGVREKLDIKDDAEWKVIEPKVTAVFDARRAVSSNSLRALFGGGRRGGSTDTQGQSSRSSMFSNPPGPAEEALQKAVDAKAPAAQLKPLLAAYRAEAKANEDKLTKAQDDLKQLLTTQQEAAAVLIGLLK